VDVSATLVDHIDDLRDIADNDSGGAHVHGAVDDQVIVNVGDEVDVRPAFNPSSASDRARRHPVGEAAQTFRRSWIAVTIRSAFPSAQPGQSASSWVSSRPRGEPTSCSKT
jgi:hypothetical protein